MFSINHAIFKKLDLNHFTKPTLSRYFNNALAKSSAERGNSNYKTTANNSAPLNRAFFVRNFRTPKETQCIVILAMPCFLSMVACDWQCLIIGCVPLFAVFHPVARYRQLVEKLAIALNKFNNGVTQMYQFIFAAIKRTDLTNKIHKIRINATTEQEARAQLAKEFILFFAGKISLKNHRALMAQGGVYA